MWNVNGRWPSRELGGYKGSAARLTERERFLWGENVRFLCARAPVLCLAHFRRKVCFAVVYYSGAKLVLFSRT